MENRGRFWTVDVETEIHLPVFHFGITETFCRPRDGFLPMTNRAKAFWSCEGGCRLPNLERCPCRHRNRKTLQPSRRKKEEVRLDKTELSFHQISRLTQTKCFIITLGLVYGLFDLTCLILVSASGSASQGKSSFHTIILSCSHMTKKP